MIKEQELYTETGPPLGLASRSRGTEIMLAGYPNGSWELSWVVCVEIDSTGLLTLSAEHVRVRWVLSELAIKCNRNLIISSDVQGEVSIVLNGVTWDCCS